MATSLEDEGNSSDSSSVITDWSKHSVDDSDELASQSPKLDSADSKVGENSDSKPDNICSKSEDAAALAKLLSEHRGNERKPALLEKEVLVTIIDSPNLFYIQRSKADKEELEMLMYRMYMTAVKTKPPNDVEVGGVYLAKFSVDNNWYRGIVTGKKGDEYVIDYIDYGNVETVPVANIRACPKELLPEKIPSYAIPCSLNNLKPKEGDADWSEAAIEIFSEMIMNVHLQMSTQGSSKSEDGSLLYNVELTRMFADPKLKFNPVLNVRESLIVLGFADPKDGIPKPLKPVTGLPWSTNYYKPSIDISKTPVAVSVIHCESPSDLHLKLVSSHLLYRKLMEQLQAYCSVSREESQSDMKVFLPQVGLLCCAQSKDNHWYRGIIVDVLSAGQVEVDLVDVGRIEVLSWYNIRKIQDRFSSQLPQQAIPCTLHNIIPYEPSSEWSDQVCSDFKNLLSKNQKNLYATFVGRNNFLYSINVSLKDEQGNLLNISRRMVDSGGAQWETCTNLQMQSDIHSKTKIPDIGLMSDSANNFDTFASSRSLIRLNPGRMQSGMIQPTTQTYGVSNEEKDQETELHFAELLSISDPGAIHVRFQSQKKKYDEFQVMVDKEMAAYIKNGLEVDLTLEIGKLCAIKLKKSPHYLRCRILEIKTDPSTEKKMVKVFLVDVGIVRDASMDHLHTLPQSLSSKRIMTITLKLFGIIPPCGLERWPSSTLDRLETIVGDTKEICFRTRGRHIKDEYFHRKILPADIGITICLSGGSLDTEVTYKKWLGQELLNDGMALPDRTESVLEKRSLSITSGDALVAKQASKSEVKQIRQACSVVPFTIEDLKAGCTTIPINDYALKDKTFDLSIPSKNVNEYDTDLLDDEPIGTLPKHAYPPAPIPKEKEFLGEITHVDYNCNFFVSPVSNRDKFEQLNLVHTFHFTNSEPHDNDTNWEVGKAVIAKYHLNNMWYRAVIVERKDFDVWVDFVDFGNRETVKFHEIRTYVPMLEMPVLGFFVKLPYIVPNDGKYNVRALDVVHAMCVEKPCKITLVGPQKEGQPLVGNVEIFSPETNMSRFLVDILQVARYVPDYPPPPNTDDDVHLESE